jgi:peptidoglycan/xylan/chitin deacetylase (PgdA/CDA1 family)
MRNGFVANPRIEFTLDGQRPMLPAPKGKPVIIHFVLNVEFWPFNQPMPRQLLTAPHGADAVPDIPNFCWAEYGLRVGLPRMLRLFRNRGIPASVSLNASVIDAYPACMDAILETGWELIGHGTHQVSIRSAESEQEVITQSISRLREVSGRKVRGWLSPGLRESMSTPDILADAGIDYLCDWGLDDLPAWMSTSRGRLIAMPYSLELNDSVVYAVEKHRSDELFSRLKLSLDCIGAETADLGPRVLGIGLHPHLMGVPHRFPFLVRMVELLEQREDICFMSGSDIADWFVSEAANERP